MNGSRMPARIGWLYAAAILLGAFELFQVEPILGKMVLPWFGGSAGVWSTCLLFFQAALLLGYAYSHGLVRVLSPRSQGLAQLALIAASLAVIPLTPGRAGLPARTSDPALQILVLLAQRVGLPFFLLSSASPLLMSWFASERPGVVPHRLYALSNAGSMLALLSYPLLVEPAIAVRPQTTIWSTAFIGFAVLCALLAWRRLRRRPGAAEIALAAEGPAPSASDYLLWVALAFCPSVLLLAVSSHITQNVAPIPFLWIVPLALYLGSFILCFERSTPYPRALYVPVMFAGIAVTAYILMAVNAISAARLAIVVFTSMLFGACMVCHGELARSKPCARFLTGFYLSVSLGGALGGCFVAIVAPSLFSDEYELAVGMVATTATVAVALHRDRRCALHQRRLRWTWSLLVGAPLCLGYFLCKDALSTAASARILVRNFYGTLRVREMGTGLEAVRRLTHGTAVHGQQFLASERRDWTTTYYGESSGGALAILAKRSARPQRVGIIGLGVGTLAAYSRVGDVYRIYELNPLVVQVARAEFSFLSRAQGDLEIVTGDARMCLEREPPQRFDVLELDAFSGDAVPVHLLTREAFARYLRHLSPRGVLAVHVSNTQVELAPLVRLAVEQFGWSARMVLSEADPTRGVSKARWVLAMSSQALLEEHGLWSRSSPIDVAPGVRLWTDDHSSLLPVLAVWTGRNVR